MTQRSDPSAFHIELPDLPDQLYFKIREVSTLTGLPPHVLRFWETQFTRFTPPRTPSGQRRYRPADVHLILTIKALLYEQKFTIKGANQYLSEHGKAPKIQNGKIDSDASTPSAYQKALRQLRDELLEIRKLLS